LTTGYPRVATPRGKEPASSRPGAADAWVYRPLPRPNSRVRLFCFPHAGAGASVYRGWPGHVPDSIEICAMQPPGREGRLREEPLVRVEDMVEAAAIALRGHIDRPYALFGHSLGALVAFEVPRALVEQNLALPLHLFVSGQQAPHLPEREPPIGRLPHDSFVAEVRRRYDGIPSEVLNTPELMDLLVPTLRADMCASEEYRYVAGPALGCPVTAYSGSEDPDATESEVAAWREHTTAPFRHIVVPGTHFFLQSSRAALLADVSATVNASLTDGQRVGELGR
jgi:medium-chain acyl-[acyl-carrier-protein] hydrolase